MKLFTFGDLDSIDEAHGIVVAKDKESAKRIVSEYGQFEITEVDMSLERCIFYTAGLTDLIEFWK